MEMINWHVQAWDDYMYWQTNEKRINALIKDILRNPFNGIGKPEQLKYEKHRLVYTIQNEQLIIAQCRYHYNK